MREDASCNDVAVDVEYFVGTFLSASRRLVRRGSFIVNVFVKRCMKIEQRPTAAFTFKLLSDGTILIYFAYIVYLHTR